MKYNEYLEYYGNLIGEVGVTKSHVDFRVTTKSPNPDFPNWRATDIERNLTVWRDECAYPGVKFERNGLIFSLDVAAVHVSGHADYFLRIIESVNFGLGLESVHELPDNSPSIQNNLLK